MYHLCNLPFFALERQSIFMTVIQNLVIMSMSILFCLLFLLVCSFVRLFVSLPTSKGIHRITTTVDKNHREGSTQDTVALIQIQKCSGCQSQNHGTVPNRKTPERV